MAEKSVNELLRVAWRRAARSVLGCASRVSARVDLPVGRRRRRPQCAISAPRRRRDAAPTRVVVGGSLHERSVRIATPSPTNTVREPSATSVLYALLFFAVLMIGVRRAASCRALVRRERPHHPGRRPLGAIRLFGVADRDLRGRRPDPQGGRPAHDLHDRVQADLARWPSSSWASTMGLVFTIVAPGRGDGRLPSLSSSRTSTGAPLWTRHIWRPSWRSSAVEVAMLVAIATFFSAFTTPMLASLFTIGLLRRGSPDPRPEADPRRSRVGPRVGFGRPRTVLLPHPAGPRELQPHGRGACTVSPIPGERGVDADGSTAPATSAVAADRSRVSRSVFATSSDFLS